MIKIIDHPLIKIKLTKMRDKNSDHVIFGKNLNEIASLMVYEILRDYKGKSKKVISPTGQVAKGIQFNKEIVIVPILRAGLGMVQGIQELVPESKIGHIGIYRSRKTFKAISYFYKMPNVPRNSEIIIVDTMLATGTSAKYAIKKLKDNGFVNIKLVCLVGVDEGINNIKSNFSDVEIYLVSRDKYLDKNKYINPGLGDAGDRLFGTK